MWRSAHLEKNLLNHREATLPRDYLSLNFHLKSTYVCFLPSNSSLVFQSLLIWQLKWDVFYDLHYSNLVSLFVFMPCSWWSLPSTNTQAKTLSLMRQVKAVPREPYHRFLCNGLRTSLAQGSGVWLWLSHPPPAKDGSKADMSKMGEQCHVDLPLLWLDTSWPDRQVVS